MAKSNAIKEGTITLTGFRAFLCLSAGFIQIGGEVMTDIQSDEAQQSPFLWIRYGISKEDCTAIVNQHCDNTRKLDNAEDKIRMARDIVELLKAADESYDGDELSLRTLDQLDRVQSLLKSAQKKIDKYEVEQKIREIENFKQGSTS